MARHYLLMISASLLTLLAIFLLHPSGAEALVTIDPVQPTHEDMITMTYTPEPEDNTSVVRLRYTIGTLQEELLDLEEDPITGNFTHDMGVFPPGTTVTYSVTAWNRTVGQDNVTVAAIVEMAWYTDLEKAEAVAARLERPMMVFFYSDGSKGSLDMIGATYRDERVLNLSAEFVVVKIDYDSHASMALNEPWHIDNLPTVVFLDNTSKEVHRSVGHRDAGEMLKEMKFALGKGPRPERDTPAINPEMLRYLILIAVILIVIISMMVMLIKRTIGDP